MKKSEKNRFEIELLSRNYLNSKRIITESEMNISHISSDRLSLHQRVVYHMDYVAETLEEREKFIIINEVMLGKRGNWFKGYMSSPSYYRYREKAYENFLRYL